MSFISVGFSREKMWTHVFTHQMVGVKRGNKWLVTYLMLNIRTYMIWEVNDRVVAWERTLMHQLICETPMGNHI